MQGKTAKISKPNKKPSLNSNQDSKEVFLKKITICS